MRCTSFFTAKKGKKKIENKEIEKWVTLQKMMPQSYTSSVSKTSNVLQIAKSAPLMEQSIPQRGAVHPTGGTVHSFRGAHSSSFLMAPYNEIFSPNPMWSRVSSLESEYSDTEAAQSSKLHSYNCRVRQIALGVFHALIKVSNVPVLRPSLRKSGHYVAHIMPGYCVPEFQVYSPPSLS